MIASPSITHEGAAGSGCHLFITGPCREAVNLHGISECCILYVEAGGDERNMTHRDIVGELLCVKVHICCLVQQFPAHIDKTSAFNGSEWR